MECLRDDYRPYLWVHLAQVAMHEVLHGRPLVYRGLVDKRMPDLLSSRHLSVMKAESVLSSYWIV